MSALCSMLPYSLAPVLKNWSPKRIVTEWEHQDQAILCP
jgi:hypothetical protein